MPNYLCSSCGYRNERVGDSAPGFCDRCTYWLEAGALPSSKPESSDTPDKYITQAHPWILPEQGLPRYNIDQCTCLITITGATGKRCTVPATYYPQQQIWLVFDDEGEQVYGADEVIAWCKLPEPYEG